MKILQITPRLSSPPNDGGAVYMFYTAKHLSKLGHEIQVASLLSNKHPQEPSLLEEYATVHAVDGQYKPYDLSAVIKSEFTRTPITVQHRMKPELMAKALDEVTFEPEIILLEGLQTAAFMELLRSRYPKLPVILRQVNVEWLLLKKNADTVNNPFLRFFYMDQSSLMKRFELNALKEADGVTAISDFDKGIYLEELPNLNCFVSPAGTEIPEKREIERKKLQLLSISDWRWKPNKEGLAWFLDNVWPTLRRNKNAPVYKIAGRGLSQSFKKTYQDDNIEFLGFVDDIESLRQSSTIFVAPLFSGSGMKIKIVEALASGMPIVTTDIGAQGIEIESNNHYLNANSVQQFTDNILSLLNDENLRVRLSENAYRVAAAKYSWEHVTKKLAGYLETFI